MKRVRVSATSNNMPGVKKYTKAVKGQHMAPKGELWQVKKSGAVRATKVFSNKKEAISYARKIAKGQQSELFIHARNGQIRERNSYGRDPFPPKG